MAVHHERKTWVDDTGQELDADWLNSVETYLDWLRTTTPVSSSFRPLKGVTSAVTSTLVSGVNMTGVGSITFWNATAHKYRFCGVVPVALTGDPSACVNDNNTFGNAFGYQPITVEFWSNATAISLYGSFFGKPDVWCLVDDQRITTGFQHYTSTDGQVTWQITVSGAVWRKWRMQVHGAFNGIAVNSGALMTETAPVPNGQVVFYGDSWTHGGITTANAVSAGVSGAIAAGSLVGEYEQFTGNDVWRFGLSGTGYINQGGMGSAGPFGSSARITKLDSIPNVNLMVVFGSVNDLATAPGTVVAAANSCWFAMKNAHPEAELVVVGLERYGTADSTWHALNDALKAAALDSPDVSYFIDFDKDPFMTGTGKDGTAAGDGNADFYLSTDATHLTHLGSRAGGEYMMRKIAPVKVSI